MTLYIHHVPGRLRIRTPALAHSAQGGDRVRALLEPVAGIRRVEVNTRANSVTVIYDPLIIAPVAILDHLATEGAIHHPAAGEPGPLLPPRAAASAVTFGAMFGKALFDAILHKSVERSIRLLVGGR